MMVGFARFASTLFLSTAAALYAGCDDSSTVPEDLLTQTTQQTADEPARPTTQELLNGPRKTITLGALPLTARVPQSWEIERLDAGSIILLQGNAPTDLVQIQLAQRPFVPAANLPTLLDRARKEKADQPQQVKVLEIKPMKSPPGGQMLEKQSVGDTVPPAPLNATGTEMSRPETLYSWTITYFVPSGDGFDAYQLNFVGLTAEQFKADEKLLREIIDSVEFNGAASSTAPALPAGV